MLFIPLQITEVGLCFLCKYVAELSYLLFHFFHVFLSNKAGLFWCSIIKYIIVTYKSYPQESNLETTTWTYINKCFFARLMIKTPPFERGRNHRNDRPELVERLWGMINNKFWYDSRLRWVGGEAVGHDQQQVLVRQQALESWWNIKFDTSLNHTVQCVWSE